MLHIILIQGLIGRYLKDAGIEINQTSFLTEIQRLVQDRLKHQKIQY